MNLLKGAYNTCVISLLVLLSNGLFGQLTIRKFVVHQTEIRPIPFTLIENKTQQISWVADENGAFEFQESAIKPTDFIRFSALGYHDKSIPYIAIRDTGVIALKPRVFTTNDLKTKYQNHTVKKLGGRHKTTALDTTYQTETGVLYTNCDSLTGIIETINVFVESPSSKPLKINIYEANKETKNIKKSLLKNTLYIKSTTRKKWVTIDVSYLEIPLTHDGFLLSVNTTPPSSFSRQYQNQANAKLGTFQNISGTVFSKQNGEWKSKPNAQLPFASYITVLTE